MFMKKTIFFYLLLFIFILPLFGCSNEIPNNIPKAKSGILDLTEWSQEKVVRLDGEWEFYWNQLLEPQMVGEGNKKSNNYINLPQTWNRYKINGSELSGEGYATYRILVKTEGRERLGLKLPRIFTAYNLWINDERIVSAGEVGVSRETMTPQYLPKVALFRSEPGENEILIQVSNFYHRSGGILESITLGTETQVLDLKYRSQAYELILFGCLIIIGAYQLSLYFFRKKDQTPLFFGLFCILVGLRTLLVGEVFFIYLFPYFNWELAHKMQTLVFYIGVPLILMFFRSVFPNIFSSKIVRYVQVVGVLFGVLVLLTPAKVFTIFNPVYQLLSIIVIAYIMYGLVWALIKKEKGSKLIFIGAIALILTSLNDIVYLSVWMNDHHSSFLRTIFRTGDLTSVGQLIFIFTNSLVLAKKYSVAFEMEENMARQLKEVNKDLDRLVLERTRALEESWKEIEYQKLELEKANDALQLISMKDSLTNLWNRRKYDETILVEWNRSLRYQRSISLLILDIDNFKAYNDSYGHSVGDECLVEIAKAMKASFKRGSDLVARYGGEEFVVIMPELMEDDAIVMANMVRKTIEDLHIPHISSPVSEWVTVSVGVTARVPEESDTPLDLFLVADKALYQAKSAGKNQVMFLID